MLNSSLQGLVVQPRNCNSRISKMDMSQRSIGDDGKLYKLVESNDNRKYHILSEEELVLERKRSQEIANRLRASQVHSKEGRVSKIGIAGKQQRIERREWKQKFAEAHAVEMIPSPDKEQPQRKAPLPPRKSAHQSQLEEAMLLLQSKYEKNLEVINLLFQEKMEMENKVHELEDKMNKDSNDFHTAIGDKPVEQPTTEKTIPAIKPAESVKIPASLAAAMFNETAEGMDNDINELNEELVEAEARRSRRNLPSQAPVLRSSSAGHGRGRSRREEAHETRDVRSTSCEPRRSLNGTWNQSVYMQTSIDRYIQRRRLIEEKEKEIEIEQRAYEQQLRERSVKAAKYGKEFNEMAKREEKANHLRRERLELQKLQLLEEEKKEREARRKAILDQINRPPPKMSMTWKEIEEQNEARRRERVEKFKQELLMTVKSDGKLFSSNQEKIQQKIQEEEKRQKLQRVFKAEDPTKVAQRLEATRRAYELQQEKKKEKQQQAKQLFMASMEKIHDIPCLVSMEERAAEYEAKKKSKLQEAEQKLKEEQLKKEAEIKRKRALLLKSKAPEASRRLTKSAVYRTNKVKEQLELEAAEKQRNERELARKAKNERELSSILRVVINEREHERKTKQPGYVELNGTQEKAIAAAQQGADDYRRRLKENKAKIAERLKDRPSLIERHEIEMRKRAAAVTALGSMMKAVGDQSDIFKKEEKMKVNADEFDF